MELWQPTCRELGSTERRLLLQQHQKFFTTPPAKAFFKASAGVELPQDPGVGGRVGKEISTGSCSDHEATPKLPSLGLTCLLPPFVAAGNLS